MTVELETGLSAENLATRKNYIGGSDANILMNGSPEDIYNLYLQKIGEAGGPELDWVLPVQIGVQTEPLNVKFFEHATGRKVRHKGDAVVCPDHAFRRATLDGIIHFKTDYFDAEAIFEAKHVNQFAKIDEVVEKYMPQLTHNMQVCGVSKAYLSVFIGTFTHEIVEVELDSFYAATLLEREQEFWKCVQDKTPPTGMEPVAAPVPPSEFRTIDMEGNNEWASSAADWLENKAAAKKFEDSKKALKTHIDAYVGLATVNVVKNKRAKNGNLNIGVVK